MYSGRTQSCNRANHPAGLSARPRLLHSCSLTAATVSPRLESLAPVQCSSPPGLVTPPGVSPSASAMLGSGALPVPTRTCRDTGDWSCEGPASGWCWSALLWRQVFTGAPRVLPPGSHDMSATLEHGPPCAGGENTTAARSPGAPLCTLTAPSVAEASRAPPVLPATNVQEAPVQRRWLHRQVWPDNSGCPQGSQALQ